MKKIPTIFARDWKGDRQRVLDIRNPVCDWVFAGEGVPTRKLDGSSCMVRDGVLYRRREIKGDVFPSDFVKEYADVDAGKTVGWIPVVYGKNDQYHREAWTRKDTWANGTYELIGPRVQGNPEHQQFHLLIRHGYGIAGKIDDMPRTFNDIREYLMGRDIEGIVFHHPDGRMAKIKLRDFGLQRQKGGGAS